ncbi:hypothetical protein K378_04645 [Streptomyces sp. Amel2xB2]|nr:MULTISPECIES: hypothetical protein [Streptomyces]RAJ59948.1 hypothetical protein K378_04645 [Streptomyces sp. Amel2xB2]
MRKGFFVPAVAVRVAVGAAVVAVAAMAALNGPGMVRYMRMKSM